jgi:hypothetical protein
MKFKRRTAEYSLLDHRNNEYILKELRVDPVEKKVAQYKQNGYIMSAGWKILDKQNNLTFDLSEYENWTTIQDTLIVSSKQVI